MGLYIFPLHLQYIQVSEEFINNPNVFTEMKIFCTLFWTAIVAIVVERCKAKFLLVDIDDAAGKVDAVDGIEEENEKLVVKSKLNPDTLVVESDAAGKVDAVDGIEEENEKLVVKSKLNQNTLVVDSNVVGAKDSDNIGEVADEKLVVASKLNPDTLVVASNVVGANGGDNSRCLVIFCPCFGGSNMVHMRNGGRRSISDVKVGDSVLAVDEMGQLRFSQVIMQLHADPEVVTEFQVIRTKTGRNLTLTPRHLIYKADNEIASSKPLFAMRIKKGDFVFVFDEKLGMIKDEVISNDIETEKGLYTPVTSHGNIIVGDILASSYAALENHSLLHLMFAPLRWFNDAKNALSSMKQMGQDEFFKYEHDDKELHWYADALLAFGNSIASEKPVCQ